MRFDASDAKKLIPDQTVVKPEVELIWVFKYGRQTVNNPLTA
jgi:hypothetical protein